MCIRDRFNNSGQAIDCSLCSAPDTALIRPKALSACRSGPHARSRYARKIAAVWTPKAGLSVSLFPSNCHIPERLRLHVLKHHGRRGPPLRCQRESRSLARGFMTPFARRNRCNASQRLARPSGAVLAIAAWRGRKALRCCIKENVGRGV